MFNRCKKISRYSLMLISNKIMKVNTYNNPFNKILKISIRIKKTNSTLTITANNNYFNNQINKFTQILTQSLTILNKNLFA